MVVFSRCDTLNLSQGVNLSSLSVFHFPDGWYCTISNQVKFQELARLSSLSLRWCSLKRLLYCQAQNGAIITTGEGLDAINYGQVKEESNMIYYFKHLVFEGGGVKGITYVGPMQVLEEKGILPGIQRVGGTSIGAINTLLFALGFRAGI